MDLFTSQIRLRLLIMLDIALLAFAPAATAEIAESPGEQSAIRKLIRGGAVVKRFEVKETETAGLLVRFKAEHLDREGCLSAELLEALLEMSRVAVEFRGLPLTDVGLKRLALKTRLIGLDLSGTNVTDRGLADLSGEELPHRESLRLLDLSFTRITDEGLKSISQWKQLRHVSVIACSVTDKGIEPFSAMPELRKAYLTNTRVTVAAVSRWRQRAARCHIEH